MDMDVVDIEKSPYIEKCILYVKDIIDQKAFHLTDEQMTLLTEEIMDTCIAMGGDYSEETIRFYAQEYLDRGAVNRFKTAHKIW